MQDFKYYDFVVRTSFFHKDPQWAYHQVKLPATNIKNAIILYLCTIDPPIEYTVPEIFSRKFFNISDAESVAYLFFQVVEFELKSVNGKTIHQFKKIKLHNRHDFLGLFDRVYQIKI